MSGPDLPRVDPTSNEIGKFEIGVSTIGDIPEFDVWTTVLSQYANSDVITGLVRSFAAYVDPTADLQNFYDMIWNVDTAQGIGLDVWGRIVGITRTLTIIGPAAYFGFQEAGDASPFGQAPFYSGQVLTTNYELTDNAYRQLILAKALANISDNSIPMLNQMLINLFPHRGNCYVTEGNRGNDPYFGFAESTTAWGFNQAPFYNGQSLPKMQMTYTFEFVLEPFELAIVSTSGVLPKPSGVQASVVQIP